MGTGMGMSMGMNIFYLEEGGTQLLVVFAPLAQLRVQ
jgi:hypothetical protein